MGIFTKLGRRAGVAGAAKVGDAAAKATKAAAKAADQVASRAKNILATQMKLKDSLLTKLKYMPNGPERASLEDQILNLNNLIKTSKNNFNAAKKELLASTKDLGNKEGNDILSKVVKKDVDDIVKNNFKRVDDVVDDTVDGGTTYLKKLNKYGGDFLKMIGENKKKFGVFTVTTSVLLSAGILYGINNGATLLITDIKTDGLNAQQVASYQVHMDAVNSQNAAAGGKTDSRINVEITYDAQVKLKTDSKAIARTDDTVSFINANGATDPWTVTYITDKKIMISMSLADSKLIKLNETTLLLDTSFNNQLHFTTQSAGQAAGQIAAGAGQIAGQVAAGAGQGLGAGLDGFFGGLKNGLGLGGGGIFDSLYKNIQIFVGILCCIIAMVFFYDMYEVVAPEH